MAIEDFERSATANASKTDEVSRLMGQIRSLKEKNQKLTHTVEKLEQRQAKPDSALQLKDSTLEVVRSARIKGEVFKNSQSYDVGVAAKLLAPILQPLMKIARGVALGNDVLTRNPERMTDERGRLTREVVRDEDNQVVYMPNNFDKLAAVSEALTSNPETAKLLTQLGELMQSDEFKADVAKKAKLLAQKSKGSER